MNLFTDLGSGEKAKLPEGTIWEAIFLCNIVMEAFGKQKPVLR
jgi:hypothetical protein